MLDHECGEETKPAPLPAAVPRPAPGDADSLRVERITRPARLEALVPQWTALADAALVPAIAQEPAWVLSCMRNLQPDDLESYAVWAPGENRADSPELVGFVTVKAANWQWGLPQGPFKSAVSRHVFDGSPLLHEQHAAAALASLYREVQSPFLFESVPVAEPLQSALEAAAEATGRQIRWFDAFVRGVYTCRSSSDDYLKDTHSRGRRNKFRRWRKQLRGDGTLELLALGRGEDLAPWMNAFLELEAKGWKGRGGTAVASSAADTAFFRDALAMLHAEGRLFFWNLARDGKPVAMLFGMRHRRHVSLGKITYDEDHARQTPGALMLLDVMDWAHAQGDIDFIDACGRPGNDMIDALWKERLEVSDCLVSGADCSPAVFGAQCKAESARRALRSTAKTLYHNVRAVTRNSR